MNEVKKLAKLLRDLDVYAYNTSFEKQAEFLIANGVTFAKGTGHWCWEGRFKACSNCGSYVEWDETLGAHFWKFCPYCGTKMNEGD